MNKLPHVLLIVPEPVTIEPPTDRIVMSCRDLSDWSGALQQLDGYTHLAVGPVHGRLSSEVLLGALDSAAPATAVVLPLAGYEWLHLISDAPLLLAWIFTDAGALTIAPVDAIPDLKPPAWLAEAGYTTFGSSLLELLRPATPIHVADVQHAAAQSRFPFHLPLLTPGTKSPNPMALRGREQMARQAAPGIGDVSLLLAGKALIDDDLDMSHTLAQSQEGRPDADYWHAIMHRREPDYGNSKYWFRHVGRHPVFAQLALQTAEILNDAPPEIRSRWAYRLKVDSGWDPFAFVDLCAAAAGDENSDLAMTARRIQWAEMLLLLKHCARVVDARRA